MMCNQTRNSSTLSQLVALLDIVLCMKHGQHTCVMFHFIFTLFHFILYLIVYWHGAPHEAKTAYIHNCHQVSVFVIAYAHVHISHDMPHTRNSQAKQSALIFCCVAVFAVLPLTSWLLMTSPILELQTCLVSQVEYSDGCHCSCLVVVCFGDLHATAGLPYYHSKPQLCPCSCRWHLAFSIFSVDFVCSTLVFRSQNWCWQLRCCQDKVLGDRST